MNAELGPVGAFLPLSPDAGVPTVAQRRAVRDLEAAGYRAAWTNEIPGKDVLVQVGVLLAATERLVLGTCVANMWVRPPLTAHAAAAQLADAYPGRFVLGLGAGYRQQAESLGQHFGTALTTARAYLQAMPPNGSAYPRILGATGPNMLALAAHAADGALPAGTGPEHTAEARRALGEERLLVVYVRADETEAIATMRAHLDAGADHVIAGATFGTDFATHVERLLRLAPLLDEAGFLDREPR